MVVLKDKVGSPKDVTGVGPSRKHSNEGRVRSAQTGIEFVESFQLQGVDGETIFQLMNSFRIDVVVSAPDEKVHVTANDVWNMTVAESDVSLVGISHLFHGLGCLDLGEFCTNVLQCDTS